MLHEDQFPGGLQAQFPFGVVPERIQLNRQQIGDVHHGRQFTKVFANPLFLSVGVSHLHSPALDLIPGIKKQSNVLLRGRVARLIAPS